MDGGGDFLKVCLNLDEDNETNKPSKKKFSYSDASKFKNSGANNFGYSGGCE